LAQGYGLDALHVTQPTLSRALKETQSIDHSHRYSPTGVILSSFITGLMMEGALLPSH